MTRPVTVISTGGTIAMAGEAGAVPVAGAQDAVAGAVARDLLNKPSVQLTGEDLMAVLAAAREELAAGRGVVITCGTDCLEEVAVLLDLCCDGPVVVTGAMRHAGSPGADGAANVRDAVAAAGVLERGVVVAFAGELHAARAVRKSDSTSVRAFASPLGGPVGRVDEGAATLWRELPASPRLEPAGLPARVHVAVAGVAADGTAVDALAAVADGLVAVVLGAGHTPPAFLGAVRRAAERMPVVATVRPERGHILRSTYAFEGAEPDLHASGAVLAGHLSPAAARVALMAVLGAGGGREELAEVLRPS